MPAPRLTTALRAIRDAERAGPELLCLCGGVWMTLRSEK